MAVFELNINIQSSPVGGVCGLPLSGLSTDVQWGLHLGFGQVTEGQLSCLDRVPRVIVVKGDPVPGLGHVFFEDLCVFDCIHPSFNF